jgi:predicted dehydrogenase
MPLRVGVAGLGAVAQAVHLPLLARHPDRFRIAAVADLSPSLRDAIGGRHDVPTGHRVALGEDLLTLEGLDAILVLTSGSHGAIAAAALHAGKTVFVEKPLAYTLAEVDRLADLAMSHPPGRLQLGLMKVHDPAVRRLGELLREHGDPIRSIEVVIVHPPPEPQLAHANVLPPPRDVPSEALAAIREADGRLARAALGVEAPARLQRLYTNVVLGSIVHDLAIVRAIASDPVAIDHVDDWPEDAWPPSVSIQGRLADGARLSIRWHYLEGVPSYREEVRVHTAERTYELVFPAPYLLNRPTTLTVTEDDPGATRIPQHMRAERRSVHVSNEEAFETQLLAFHALAVDGTPPPSGIPAGRTDVIICQAVARRFAELRGWPIGGEAATIDAGALAEARA